MRVTKLEAGQRFVSTTATVGSASVGAWEVVDLFEGSDGHRYARLVNALDRSRIKTFAQDALLDRKLFQRVE